MDKVKYMGSKNRISKEILPIISKDRKIGQWYVEPFCGGCNMIDKINDKLCIANDFNNYLIAMFIKLQSGWIPDKEITKEFYTEVKDNKDKYPDWLVGYIGFNCSYSGKWFGGYAGKTKTKVGIRDYQAEAFKNVMEQIKNLKNVKFKNGSYDSLYYPERSIIYCDPPYESTTKYKDDFNHKKFWKWCRDMSNRGHVVFVSEYNASDDFECVWEKKVKSSLSANGKTGGNKVSTEKLFIYKLNSEEGKTCSTKHDIPPKSKDSGILPNLT